MVWKVALSEKESLFYWEIISETTLDIFEWFGMLHVEVGAFSLPNNQEIIWFRLVAYKVVLSTFTNKGKCNNRYELC